MLREAKPCLSPSSRAPFVRLHRYKATSPVSRRFPGWIRLPTTLHLDAPATVPNHRHLAFELRPTPRQHPKGRSLAPKPDTVDLPLLFCLKQKAFHRAGSLSGQDSVMLLIRLA